MNHIFFALDVSRFTGRSQGPDQQINTQDVHLLYWQMLQMSLILIYIIISAFVSHQHIDHATVLPREVHEGVPPTVRQKNHTEKREDEVKGVNKKCRDTDRQTATFTLPAVI